MNYNNKKLLFRNEVLQARLHIRDFFLANTVRDIYENTAQLLSLARMQLALPTLSSNQTETDNIPSTEDLLGESIRNLRAMSSSFHCDTNILEESGFTEALNRTLEIVYRDLQALPIKSKVKEEAIQAGMKIILFRMLQEILISIKEPQNLHVSLNLLPRENKIEFLISFKGKFQLIDEAVEIGTGENGLSILQRAKLVGATMKASVRRQNVRIRLISPVNCTLYE